jgi:C4-dicarboxylate-specific signal transduction histidine kinase
MFVVCAFAFFAVWSRRRSVLDYWLIIVALALICEVALSLAGSARFSLGFYANRTFSLITSATILVLLLAETTKLYARLARSNMMLQHERSNKLMNMEAMVASISHEVRQPLASIVANSNTARRFLGRQPPDFNEVRSALDRIESNSHRASQIFDSFRALFGRTGQGEMPIDVNEMVLEVLQIMRGELKDNEIATRIELMPELPPIMGHKGQSRRWVQSRTATGSCKSRPRGTATTQSSWQWKIPDPASIRKRPTVYLMRSSR